MNNPYSWNAVNPDLFFGREWLLSEMLAGLSGNRKDSFGLAGGRRMGKTTLLRRLEKDMRAGIEQWKANGLVVVPVYVDGLSLPQPLKAAHIWEYILTEIQAALSVDFPRVSPVDFAVFRKLLKEVLPEYPLNVRVVLLFDEIEPILVNEWGNGFLDNCRALLSNSPGLHEFFTAAFAGAHEMKALQIDLGSPLRDILEWRNLQVLDYESACDLMQKPIEHFWPESFLRRMYVETGGHPMLLQYLMQQICGVDPYPAEPELTEELNRAVKKFLKDRQFQMKEWWVRYCTPTAQRVYSRLPDDGSYLERREIVREFGLDDSDEALQILKHVGIVMGDEDDFCFRYSGEMFRCWYRRYGQLADDAEHDPEIYARLRRIEEIGEKVAGKYLSAWGIYKAQVPNYSGVLVELRGVLESLVDQYAPNDQVMASQGFKLETDHAEPTLRQRIRYFARQTYNNERTKEIVSDYNLLEQYLVQISEHLSQTGTMAHRSASSMAHDTATRDMAFRALKQWEGILALLVPA